MPETVNALNEHLHRLPDGRQLAWSSVGPTDAVDVLLCLPGLLETRHSFDPVLQAARAQRGLLAISLDHCGRGDSSRLPGDAGYSMATYLADVRDVIACALPSVAARRWHVLGTSMGGLLGLYLASDATVAVRTLILNDIGLSFDWVSIYGLFDGMKHSSVLSTPQAWAAQLRVSPGVLRAVQSPAHFDLPYRKDWKGMKFAHLLNHYSGALSLVHGHESGVCRASQVQELRQQVPHARVLEVAGAGHPVPFTPGVCEFVLGGWVPQTDSTASADATPAIPAPAAASHGVAKTAGTRRGWWQWLRDKLH